MLRSIAEIVQKLFKNSGRAGFDMPICGGRTSFHDSYGRYVHTGEKLSGSGYSVSSAASVETDL